MHVGLITPSEAEDILTRDGVWEWVCDSTVDRFEWRAPADKQLYLGVFNPHLVGVFAFDGQGAVHAICHAGLTYGCRGDDAIHAGFLAIRWLKNNTNILRLTAPVAVPNRKAALFVRWIGFKPYALNPCAALHEGLPCDVRLYGLTLDRESKTWAAAEPLGVQSSRALQAV